MGRSNILLIAPSRNQKDGILNFRTATPVPTQGLLEVVTKLTRPVDGRLMTALCPFAVVFWELERNPSILGRHQKITRVGSKETWSEVGFAILTFERGWHYANRGVLQASWME